MRQKAINNNDKQMFRKVGTGTPTVIWDNLCENISPDVCCHFVLFVGPRRCYNSSKINAKTGAEQNHEHHQQSYFVDVYKHANSL